MGCTLHVTKKDYEQMKTTLQKVTSPTRANDILKGYKSRLESIPLKNNEDLNRSLKDAKINKINLVLAISNTKLSEQYARLLPKALNYLSNTNGKAVQMFNCMSNTLWNSKSVNGIAYKVLAASRLLSTPDNGLSISKNDLFTIGRHLRQKSNHISRQQKPSSDILTSVLMDFIVEPAQVVVQDFVVEPIGTVIENIFLPQKNTPEPDLTIHRGEKNIGVDFNYQSSDSPCKITGEELRDIVFNLKNERLHVNEYHIVCNNKFAEETIKVVEEKNKELRAEGKTTIELHGEVNLPMNFLVM